MNDLSGGNAVITGGNSGIGYATAKKLKANGANVIITGRSTERVNAAAKELGVRGIVADVANLSALDDLVEHVKGEFAQLDILFVNAGIFAPAAVGQNTEEMFDTQMGINFKGAVYTIEKFLPLMNAGASIADISEQIQFNRLK